jgi:RNA polymerase sigma factor (sigma-70 family)
MKWERPRQLGVGWEINWSCPVFVARFRSGEAGVLAAIYKLHLSDVRFVVRNGFGTTGPRRAFIPGLRREHERDDLVQEVFSRAFTSRARLSFDPTRAYGPYLLAIGRHVLVDWHRSDRQRRRLDGSLWEVMCLTESSQSVVASDPGPDKAIEAYVDTLDRRLQEVFDQMVVRGRSQRDTALALGLSRQNVRTLEQRLRAGIKRAVDG